jgi:hypothetical protein
MSLFYRVMLMLSAPLNQQAEEGVCFRNIMRGMRLATGQAFCFGGLLLALSRPADRAQKRLRFGVERT